MMMTITQRQAQALAAFIATIRDDWDPAGIYAALGQARDRGTTVELAHAAITAASTPTNRTPAVIALAGPHWTTATPTVTPIPGPGTSERCPVDGHLDAATSCRACRAEFLADGKWHPESRHHDARPATTTTRPLDSHERAAGEREE